MIFGNSAAFQVGYEFQVGFVSVAHDFYREGRNCRVTVCPGTDEFNTAGAQAVWQCARAGTIECWSKRDMPRGHERNCWLPAMRDAHNMDGHACMRQ
ncbi:hypothetical protein GCM10027278_07650 [Paralcaligenes ginsengisoli]